MDNNHLNYSALALNGQKWWQKRSFRVTFIVSTFIYGLFLASISAAPTFQEAVDVFALATAAYLISLTVAAAAASSSADSKRSLDRLTRFAEDNGFAFENFSKPSKVTGVGGQRVTTASLVLETLRQVIKASGGNQKIWQLSGDYSGTAFSLYTLLLGVGGRGMPRWYYASVIEMPLEGSHPSFVALSKRNLLSSYLTERKMNSAGLYKIPAGTSSKRKTGYIYYRPESNTTLSEAPIHLIDPIAAIDSRSVEVAGNSLFIIGQGGFKASEREMKQAFSLIDKAARTFKHSQ